MTISVRLDRSAPKHENIGGYLSNQVVFRCFPCSSRRDSDSDFEICGFHQPKMHQFLTKEQTYTKCNKVPESTRIGQDLPGYLIGGLETTWVSIKLIKSWNLEQNFQNIPQNWLFMCFNFWMYMSLFANCHKLYFLIFKF